MRMLMTARALREKLEMVSDDAVVEVKLYDGNQNFVCDLDIQTEDDICVETDDENVERLIICVDPVK